MKKLYLSVQTTDENCSPQPDIAEIALTAQYVQRLCELMRLKRERNFDAVYVAYHDASAVWLDASECFSRQVSAVYNNGLVATDDDLEGVEAVDMESELLHVYNDHVVWSAVVEYTDCLVTTFAVYEEDLKNVADA